MIHIIEPDRTQYTCRGDAQTSHQPQIVHLIDYGISRIGICRLCVIVYISKKTNTDSRKKEE